MSVSSNWPRDLLLRALPSSNLRQFLPELEHIRCQRAQILMDADSSLDHVFFPDGGVVSAVAVYAVGRTIEMATIGRGVARLCKPSGCKEFLRPISHPDPGGRSGATFTPATASMPTTRTSGSRLARPEQPDSTPMHRTQLCAVHGFSTSANVGFARPLARKAAVGLGIISSVSGGGLPHFRSPTGRLPHASNASASVRCRIQRDCTLVRP